MKPFLHALIIAAAWIVGYAFARVVSNGMSAAIGYALVTGWWFAAFVASKLMPDLRSALFLMGGYYIAFLIVSMPGNNWFYAEAGDAPFMRVAAIGLFQAVVVGAPIIFNILVDWGIRKAKMLERD